MPLTTNPRPHWYVDQTPITVRLNEWRDMVVQANQTYERLQISINNATTASQVYLAEWNANLTAATYGATYGSNIGQWITADYQWQPASEEQTRRWRREKLEVLRASKRARKTLMKFLDQEQLASYAATGRFRVVASNGWVFELRKQGNPLLLGDDGHADASFCIHPREVFPKEDTLLSFMLMLMSDVDDFLKIANRTTIRQRPLAPVPPQPAAHEGLIVIGQAA